MLFRSVNLFGYVRVFKPHLRICEFDTYKSVYCGLCKELGKSFGFVSRFTLSYDFTFLAMFSMALNGRSIKMEKQRCIAHPLKKTVCAICTEGLDYPASAAVLTIYHKLKDDRADKGFKKKFIAICLLPFTKKSYKKAKNQYPELSETIENAMKEQTLLEKENCKSLDRASEPTAIIMKAIFSEISSDDIQKKVLERFGYLLGRYVYFCDALDDLKDDYIKKSYNALLLQKEITELNENEIEYFRGIATDTINFTLGELANTYVLLPIEKYKPILDNIIYLGLKNTFVQILKGEIEKEKK